MIKSNCSPILTTLGRQYKSDLDCDNRSMVQGEFDLALHFQFLLKQLCKFKVEKYCNIQSFPSHHSLRFFGLVLVSSPDLWAPTAASYFPSRAGELPKQNMTKPHVRWDGKLCRNAAVVGWDDSKHLTEKYIPRAVCPTAVEPWGPTPSTPSGTAGPTA